MGLAHFLLYSDIVMIIGRVAITPATRIIYIPKEDIITLPNVAYEVYMENVLKENNIAAYDMIRSVITNTELILFIDKPKGIVGLWWIMTIWLKTSFIKLGRYWANLFK